MADGNQLYFVMSLAAGSESTNTLHYILTVWLHEFYTVVVHVFRQAGRVCASPTTGRACS